MTTADLLTSLRAEQHDFANARLNAVLRRELDRAKVADRHKLRREARS